MFEWLTGDDVVLERLTAALSEGYCPNCEGRLTNVVPFIFDDEESDEILGRRDRLFAQGGCSTCGHWLRAGHEGSNPERDWFSASMLHPKSDELEGSRVTMALNPPGSDDDWEPDYDEEEYE